MSATLQERIDTARAQLGSRLTIFGHHYQNDAVIKHTDASGDSLELARMAARTPADFIVFCGVHFMGESAALLAKNEQKVFLPEERADCIMAKMAPAKLLNTVMQKLDANGRKVIPLTYVNSSLGIKAVCGKYGGSVCTSSNAEKMLTWAMNQGDAVLFVPDKNLGANIARNLGMPETEQHILDIRQQGANLDLPAQAASINQAKLLLWPGCCAIHARFGLKHIEQVRKDFPDVQVIVHPECTPPVVMAADFAGSTSALIKYVDSAPQGSNIAVGTEINLVRRLQQRYAGQKNVFPLMVSDCANMAMVTQAKLADLLERIIAGQASPLVISGDLVAPARKALEIMLDVCS